MTREAGNRARAHEAGSRAREESLRQALTAQEAARARLTATLVDLRARLTPKALAREAVEELREGAEELGASAIAFARRHPGPIAGIALTLVALFARHWIAPVSPAPSPEGAADDNAA